MPQATTQSPMQQITQAEANTRHRVEEAKKLALKELEAFKAEEEKRLAERKTFSKEKAAKTAQAEEKKLESVLAEGRKETEKKKEELEKHCKKNEAGIVAELVTQFLSLEP